MNEEEAIKQLKQWISVIDLKKKSNIIPNTDDIQAIETVLNLLERKDKIIEEMAKYINDIDFSETICDEMGTVDNECEFCIDCIIKYFKNKIQEEK